MSLTEDWQNGTLKGGWYFVNNHRRGIVPDQYMPDDTWLVSNGFSITEVLAPCDYDHFIELTEKVNRSGENAARFEMALYDANREIKHLRGLLKECDGCVRTLRAKGVSDCNGSELNDLITRINKELQ